MKNLRTLLPLCLLLTLLSLSACAGPTEGSAPEEEDESVAAGAVVLRNELGFDMEALYLSEDGDADWGASRLKGIWCDGERLSLDLAAEGYDEAGTTLDLQLMDSDGDVYQFMGLPLRAGDRVTLTWNEETVDVEAIVTSGGKDTTYFGALYLTSLEKDAEPTDERKAEVAAQGTAPAPSGGGSKSDPGDYGSPYYYHDEDGDLWYWNGYEDQYIGSGDDYYIDCDQYFEANDAGWNDDCDPYDADEGWGDYFE